MTQHTHSSSSRSFLKKPVVIALSAGIVAFLANQAIGAKEKPWPEKMQKLGSLMDKILPSVFSEEKFIHVDRNELQNEVKELATLAHSMQSAQSTQASSSSSPDQDPSITLISELFEDQAHRALDEVKRGHMGYARTLIRGLTTYCFNCHTTSNFGPSFTEPSQMQGLSRFEKANLLAATRRFEPALDEFESMISDQSFIRTRKIEWEKAVNKALAISVRVNKDPKRSYEIVKRALSQPGIASFFREDAEAWKKSIRAWMKEPKKTHLSEEGLFAEVRLLFSKAQAKQKYPTDRAATIDYLRATSAAHDLLRNYPKGAHATEALYFLGVGYEALSGLGLWTLHEMYYELCIRKGSKSRIAKSCYHRLEESIHAGYTGSGGFSIPSDVQNRLNELKKLAG